MSNQTIRIIGLTIICLAAVLFVILIGNQRPMTEDEYARLSSVFTQEEPKVIVNTVTDYGHGVRLVRVGNSMTNNSFADYAIAQDPNATNGCRVMVFRIQHEYSTTSRISGHKLTCRLAIPIRY